MYSKQYFVLSNDSIIQILLYGIMISAILAIIFSYLGRRDASPIKRRRSIVGKIVPWIVLCIFISDIAVLISRLADYPWSIEAQPSQASMYREIRYYSTGICFWGWANDDQLPILSSLTGSIMSFCWTVYAFRFKKSDTSWWKKILKFLAYLLISSSILGFQMHEIKDLFVYAIIWAIAIILLKIAHVKPLKQEINVKISSNFEEANKNEIEDILLPSEKETRKAPIPTDNFQKRWTQISPPNEVIDDTNETIDSIDNCIDNKRKIASSNNENNRIIDETNTQQPSIDKTDYLEDDIKKDFNSFEEEKSKKTNYIEIVYCKYCGKIIEYDSTFCKYCGGKQ